MPKNPIISDILRVREKQIAEGHTTVRNGTYNQGELVLASLAYALYDPRQQEEANDWPFPFRPFTPHEDRRSNLLEAAALLVAEIERCDREDYFARQEQRRVAEEGEGWKKADG